jgi:regulator of protease activity HflC (stomatin/prohibitin superfamily)
MKKGLIGAISLGVIIVVALICIILCVERIPDGYEGVVISMSHGAEDKTLHRGWHVVSPTKKVKLFNTSNEQLVLTKDKREGSKGDDSFRVSTSDDATIAISFQMSYKFNDETVVDTYRRFRGMDGSEIIDSRVRTVMKSKVSEVTTSHSLMDIYSGNRAGINDELTKYLNNSFKKDYGIEVLSASIIDVHPDKQLRKTINNRITAVQRKQQAQAEQETAKVEAATALIKAQNEAEIQITKAKAEAEANKVKAASITDELIKMTEAEARKKHGWVTVQGAGTAVVTEK